ncbi:MAG: vitamin K epoxide reductase family protein [Candidatus Zixiibacteriota bacterium]
MGLLAILQVMYGVDYTKRQITTFEKVALSLPILHLLIVVFFAYDSIVQFVLLSLALLAGEAYLWQKMTVKSKDFAKKLAIIIPTLMMFVASVGIGASYSLAKEKQALQRDPNFVASCTLNPIVSCNASVTGKQGSALGVSNPQLGIASYGALLLLGLLLVFGLKLSTVWWRIVWAGALFGLVYCAWLISQSLYVIGTLCLYCSTIWAVTIGLFFYLTAYELLNNYIPSSKSVKLWIVNNHTLPLLVTYGLVILLVYFRWSDYWNSLFL